MLNDQNSDYDSLVDTNANKILAIDEFFNNQKQACDELRKYVSDIAKELATLRIENLNGIEIVQRQNVIISQLSMLLIKIKNIDDKKFQNLLKTHEIDLSTISENIH